MDLIKTIEDDATIQYESDESSEDEPVAVTKKVKKGSKSSKEDSDFFDEFKLVGDAKDYMKDTW
jgi:hypothetical protein